MTSKYIREIFEEYKSQATRVIKCQTQIKGKELYQSPFDPFPVWLGYIWLYVLGLVLENANVKSRMGMNVELRFKRVRSRRKNSIRMYRSGNADGLCERMDSHRYRGFVAWWTPMESMTLLVIGIERPCHLDIATPPAPLTSRVPFNNAIRKTVSVDGTFESVVPRKTWIIEADFSREKKTWQFVCYSYVVYFNCMFFFLYFFYL